MLDKNDYVRKYIIFLYASFSPIGDGPLPVNLSLSLSAAAMKMRSIEIQVVRQLVMRYFN